MSIFAIFNDQRFNDTLTNDIISFEHLGPGSGQESFVYYNFCQEQLIIYRSIKETEHY